MITFTKDLSLSNRKGGEWLLGYYWRDSVISKSPYYPITNWAGMISFLDSNYPTFIESLGEQLKTISSDKMIKIMKDVAARNLTDYPRPSYFSNSEINIAGTLDYGQIASDTASDVGTEIVAASQSFTTLLKWTIVGAAGVLLVVLYQRAGGKFSMPDFKKFKWKS